MHHWCFLTDCGTPSFPVICWSRRLHGDREMVGSRFPYAHVSGPSFFSSLWKGYEFMFYKLGITFNILNQSYFPSFFFLFAVYCLWACNPSHFTVLESRKFLIMDLCLRHSFASKRIFFHYTWFLFSRSGVHLHCHMQPCHADQLSWWGIGDGEAHLCKTSSATWWQAISAFEDVRKPLASSSSLKILICILCLVWCSAAACSICTIYWRTRTASSLFIPRHLSWPSAERSPTMSYQHLKGSTAFWGSGSLRRWRRDLSFSP